MNRYLSSFVLSFAIYVSVVTTIFYFISNNNCEANSKIEVQKIVKISLLNLQKEGEKQAEPKKELEISKPKQEVKKESKKVELTKVEPKKIVNKVSLPLMEHTKNVENVEKVASKEETFTQEAKVTEKVVSNTALANQEKSIRETQKTLVELQERQKSFFLELRALINQNKSYPNSARRRGIQGDVQVRFDILENGNVDNIELISGQSIFKNSVQEAIEKSFPIQVDKTLFSFPKEFKITLAYVLIPDVTN